MITRTSHLEKIYDRDPVSKAFIISISIDHYGDVFNYLDPAPFKRRDLDPELREYLEACSGDIPLKYPVILQFDSPVAIKDEETEEKVKAGLTTYFQFTTNAFKKDISSSYRKSFTYILTAFLLLGLSFYFHSFIPEESLFSLSAEGFYIGGWVFLWEAIAILVFKNRELYLQYKRYRRLHAATVHFSYL